MTAKQILCIDRKVLVQRQIASGKYQTAIEVLFAGVQLLEQQEDSYQERLQEIQQEALI